jgi:hypothetical protein
MGINIDLSELNQKLETAFIQTSRQLNNKLREKIESSEYEWDRTTHRQNRSVVNSPRDIVDLGNLRDSQDMQIDTRNLETNYEWDIDYALEVHEGAMRNDGTMKPARRWTERAIEEIDIVTNFGENYGN